MPAPLTLQFGTYTFPNQTFEVLGHNMFLDTPVYDSRRTNNGQVFQSFMSPKTFKIRGKIYGTDIDDVHNQLTTMQRALLNKGNSASLIYRSDRFVTASLAKNGFVGNYEAGLYQYLANVDITMISPKPCAEDNAVTTVSGSRTNNSAIQSVTPGGNYPASPVFTFVAGANFSNDLRVDNNANSMYFGWSGPMVNGQTLVIDVDAGCVLLQVGLTFIDATSYFFGNMFLTLDDAQQNDLVINAATLTYSITFRKRYFA